MKQILLLTMLLSLSSCGARLSDFHSTEHQLKIKPEKKYGIGNRRTGYEFNNFKNRVQY